MMGWFRRWLDGHPEPARPSVIAIPPSENEAEMDWEMAADLVARASSCLFTLQLQLRGVSGQRVYRSMGPIKRGCFTYVEIEAAGGVIVLQVNDADDSAALTVRLPAPLVPASYEPMAQPVPEDGEDIEVKQDMAPLKEACEVVILEEWIESEEERTKNEEISPEERLFD